MNIKVVGVDLAKHVIQICALSDSQKVLFNKAVSRSAFLDSLRSLPLTTVAMEACSTAHYWAREISQLGHKVLLIPAQHTKAFVRNGKSDAKDALAIAEAAQRPNIHFVPVKTIAQQDLMLLHSAREALVQQRTATLNRLQSISGEYGVLLPKGAIKCLAALTPTLEDAENGLSFLARQMLQEASEQWHYFSTKLVAIERQIKQLSKQQEAYTTLQSVPGIGPIIASTILASIGNGECLSILR